MRVLTVKQPWAWAIIHGGKDVENRTTNIVGAYRGSVAIHAGYGWADAAKRFLRRLGVEPPSILDRGAIIGVIDIVDVHQVDDAQCRPPAMCSRWALRQEDFPEVERPQYRMRHLVLANPRPLPRPIPATGRLGLWHPDADLLAAIAEQMAEVA